SRPCSGVCIRISWLARLPRPCAPMGDGWRNNRAEQYCGEGRISREKRHCLPISGLIWRKGANFPRKCRVFACFAEGVLPPCHTIGKWLHVMTDDLRHILEQIQSGRLSVDTALERLNSAAVADLGY